MGSFSIWHWLVVLVVVLILFGGGGKISQIMGDFGKGLKSFKKGLKEDDEAEAGGEAKGVPPQAASLSSAQPATPPPQGHAAPSQAAPPQTAPAGPQASRPVGG